MKSYTISKEKLNFSESINIPEPTDSNHADNINAAPKQLLENDIALKKEIEKNKVYSATGTELELETGEGGIRINRIYGKTVKSPNLFKFEVTAKDVTEREGRNITQRFNITERDGVITFTYQNINNNNYNMNHIELLGIDGTKDYHISYKVVENNTGYEPYVVKNTSKSNVNRLVLDFWGGNIENHVQGGKFFKLANISVTEEEVREYQPWGLRSAGEKEHLMKIADSSLTEKKLNGVTVIAKKKCFKLINHSTNYQYGELISFEENKKIESGTYLLKMKIKADRSTVIYTDFYVNKVFEYQDLQIASGVHTVEMLVVAKETKITKGTKFVAKLHVDNATVEVLESEIHKINIVNIPNLVLREINAEYRDYIDLKRKKIVRKVKKVVLDGSENYQFYNKQWAVSGLTNDVLPNVNNSTLSIGKSDRFLADILHNTYAGINDFRFAVSNTNMQDGLRGYISTVNSAEQAKTFFKDNPTTFFLAYKEPVEEDLTTEQIKALTSLKSFVNQTIITTTDGLAELDVSYGKVESVALGLLADNAKLYAESLEKEIEKKSEILENKIEEKNTEILSRLGKKYIYSQTAPTETEAIWVKTSDRNDVITAETFAHVGGRWKKLTESKISHVEAVIDDLKICPSTEQQGSGTDYWTNESFRSQYENNRRRAFDDFCEHIIDGNSMIMKIKKVHPNASYGMQMQMWGKLYICMTDGRRIPFGKLAKENNVETRITFSVETNGNYQYGFIGGYDSQNDSIFSNGGDMFHERPNKRVYDFKKHKLELPQFLLRTGRYQGNWGKFTFQNAIINNIPYPVIFMNEAQ